MFPSYALAVTVLWLCCDVESQQTYLLPGASCTTSVGENATCGFIKDCNFVKNVLAANVSEDIAAIKDWFCGAVGKKLLVCCGSYLSRSWLSRSGGDDCVSNNEKQDASFPPGSTCSTPNNELAFSVPETSCSTVNKRTANVSFYEKSKSGCFNGTVHVCCGNGNDFQSERFTKQTRRKSALPHTTICGLQQTEDNANFARSETEFATSFEQFPWTVTVERFEIGNDSNAKPKYTCLGSIIDRHHVLTSADCAAANRDGVNFEIKVTAGEYSRMNVTDCIDSEQILYCSEGTKTYTIAEVIIHPNVSRSNVYNNIALLRVNTDEHFRGFLPFTNEIRSICLPNNNTIRLKTNDEFFTTGWGMYSNDSSVQMFTDLKKEASNNLVPFRSCAKYVSYNENPDKLFCSKNDKNCDSDLGGPLMSKQGENWIQHGIFVKNSKCGPDSVGVYVKLYDHMEWIKENIFA